MLWKAIDTVMLGLSFAAVIATFMPWWPPGHPAALVFALMQFAWMLTLLRRRGHEPYPTASGWLSETAAGAATPPRPPPDTRRATR